jgi:putative FmdB family regulatory protein
VPLYEYRCAECRNVQSEFRSVAERDNAPECHGHMRRILTVPMACVREVNYTSPVDGRPITSMAAHQEELARNNSVVYEPGIKQDQERNERRREQALESKVEKTVEKEIAAMPARKREKLAAELQGGLTAEPVRSTAGHKPITQTVER